MTASDLQTIMGINNVGKWSKFGDFTIIYLDQDTNIYLSGNEIFYVSDDTMFISHDDKYIKMNADEISSKSTDFFPVHTKIDMNSISGMISTSVIGPYGGYFTRPF